MSGERGEVVYAVANMCFKILRITKKSCWTSLTKREKQGSHPQSRVAFKAEDPAGTDFL